MTSRSLNPKTKQLLKDWYLGNLSVHGEMELMNSLIGELNQTKQNQVDRIQKDYLR
ncbi:hypothetical protein KAU33_03880 [Candidatus Dependentiae bacterium]|nr:hypothetical protein [Candidatus Dependentiae bacterium]